MRRSKRWRGIWTAGTFSKHLPEKKIIQAGKFKIGLIHGGGSVRDLEDRVVKKFRDDKVDCIVYGHSHRANVERRDNVLLVNPGSPTDKIHAALNSYAVITVNDDLKAEIVKL